MSLIEKLGKEVVLFEEFLNSRYGEGNWTLNTYGIIGDLTVLDEHSASTPITFHFSDPRRWVQEALMEKALEELEKTIELETPRELGPGEEEDIDAS